VIIYLHFKNDKIAGAKIKNESMPKPEPCNAQEAAAWVKDNPNWELIAADKRQHSRTEIWHLREVKIMVC